MEGQHMKKVNVYLYTTARSPNQGKAAYTYVLEMDTAKGTETRTHTEIVEGMTPHQAELSALAAAVKRIFRKCSLMIYTDSKYLAAGAEKWMAGWKKKDWKNAKGGPVANMQMWQDISCLLEAHEYHFAVGVKHNYYDWMQSESERAVSSVYSRGDRRIRAGSGRHKAASLRPGGEKCRPDT